MTTIVKDDAQKVADGFQNFAARMGTNRGITRNVASESTWLLNRLTQNRDLLDTMYRSSWMVGAGIDGFAEDMVRAGINIHGLDDPTQTKQLQKYLTATDVWGSLLDAIKWSRLYGGAIAYINIEGQDPATPLDLTTIAQNQFIGLQVYDRWQLAPTLFTLIQNGKDAGLPMYYTVLANPATGLATNITIHYTRVVRLIGIELPAFQRYTEQNWGMSILERMFDSLVGYSMTSAATTNLINNAFLRVIKVNNLRENLAMGGDMENSLLKTFDVMAYLQGIQGITLLDGMDEYQQNSYTFSGLPEIVLHKAQEIAGGFGMPLVKLFGQAPAGMNATGESDWRMYYDSIFTNQESRLREPLSKILQICYISKFGQFPPDEMDFDFVALWQTTAQEKSTLALNLAEMINKLGTAGYISQAIAMKELKSHSDENGYFGSITDEDIAEAQLEEPPTVTQAKADVSGTDPSTQPTATEVDPSASSKSDATPAHQKIAQIVNSNGLNK